MVKNKSGGNRHKKMASKNSKPLFINRKVRLAIDKDELYAKVLKCYGQGRFLVLCNDNIERLLIIARKFKGRNKRDNIVVEGGMVLVGLRNFEVRDPKKKEHVDLLYVYSPTSLSKLKKDPAFNTSVFFGEITDVVTNDSFIIGNYIETSQDEKKISEKVNEKLNKKKEEDTFDEKFSFDDI